MGEEPAYKWSCLFRSGLQLNQFERGEIHQFSSEVAPYGENVKTFSLRGNRHTIDVDLDTGDFLIDGKLPPFKFAKHVDVEYSIAEERLRPIFFRRTTRQINMVTGKEIAPPHFVYAVGWQATVKIPHLEPGARYWSEKEVNVKHILYLHPDGSMVFG